MNFLRRMHNSFFFLLFFPKSFFGFLSTKKKRRKVLRKNVWFFLLLFLRVWMLRDDKKAEHNQRAIANLTAALHTIKKRQKRCGVLISPIIFLYLKLVELLFDPGPVWWCPLLRDDPEALPVAFSVAFCSLERGTSTTDPSADCCNE